MKNKCHILLSVVALCFVYSLTVPVALAWDPLTDAGANLIGWYDASDGDTVQTSGTTVTNWSDKSGNNYDMDTRSGSPEFDGLAHINGLTAVRFVSTERIYRDGIPDIDLVNGVCLISVGQGGPGGDWHNWGRVKSADGSSFLHYRRDGTSPRMTATVKINGLGDAFKMANNEGSYANDIPFMCAVYYDPAGMAYLRGNGGVDNASGVRDAAATFTINNIHAGQDSNTQGQYHGEMIVLSTVDINIIEKVEGYLAHKWTLYDKLPTDHPYRYHEPDAPIPFGAVSVSNITATTAELYVEAETNLTSATVVWDTLDKGKTNLLVWAGSNSVSLGSTPGTISNTPTSLTEDTWYYFRFYGEDATTNGWSIEHRFATALTAKTPQFIAAYPSSSKVILSWADNADTETAYILQRATSSGGPYSDLATLATDATEFGDNTVSADTTYYYRLYATNSSSMTATDPSACQITATTTTDEPWITLSTTAPTSNEADIAYLDLSNLNGTGDKMWTDSPGYGQTFLTGSKGGKLKAITHVNKTTYVVPTKRFGVRVGKIDGSTFSGIYWDSADQTNDTTVANMYWTFNFATPIDLEPDTLYGVDMQADASGGTGIPYWQFDNSNVYPDGRRYTITRGYPTTVSLANNDRIFHLDIDFPPPAGTMIMVK